MMGWGYDVSGWTFGDRFGIGKSEWHYTAVYQGDSLIRALIAAFRARRSYGCVKLEMR